jgi:hypothetical protein
LIDTSNNLEIVKVTAVSTDTFTIVRGAESTTERAYSAGDRIELRVTAAGLGETVSAAAASATAAAADEVLTDADVVLTHADVVLTHADVVLTNADVVSTTAAVGGANAFRFTWSNSTTMADPGTGYVRFNHGTVGSVTNLAFDATSADAGNPDVSDFLASMDDSTGTSAGYIQFRKRGTPATYAVFSVTGAVADNTGWLQATVTHVSSSGTWSNADISYMSFARAGDNGSLTSVVADTTPQLGGFLDANGHYIQTEKGGDLTSASPLVIDTDGDYFDVTGTTNFAVMTVAADRQFTLQFDGALTMTHHATNIDLPGEANITTAAGDVGVFQSTGANTVQCISYTKADGTAVSAGAGGGPSKGTAPSTFYRTNGKVQNENIVISNHSATFSAVHGAETASRGTDDGFADDMNVRLTGSDLPNGWVIDTDYFVRDVASATLKLALTIGGSAVAISDNGSGTNTIFEVINAGVIGPITIKSGNTLTIPSGSRVLIQ